MPIVPSPAAGLDCGDCFIPGGNIAQLAKKRENELVEAGFERFAAALAGLTEEMKPSRRCAAFKEVLSVLQGAPARWTAGRGATGCRKRLYCKEKKVFGCWGYDDFGSCSTPARLRPVNGDTNPKTIYASRASRAQELCEVARSTGAGTHRWESLPCDSARVK